RVRGRPSARSCAAGETSAKLPSVFGRRKDTCAPVQAPTETRAMARVRFCFWVIATSLGLTLGCGDDADENLWQGGSTGGEGGESPGSSGGDDTGGTAGADTDEPEDGGAGGSDDDGTPQGGSAGG